MARCVVIAGGSGFLGRALAGALVAAGDDVVILARDPATRVPACKVVAWDGRTVGAWARELDGADAVVNLAGRSVNCRYTKANRRQIVDSRVDSVRAIGAALAASAQPPRAWVQASSLAIYGDAAERWCDEDTPPGAGFPAQTCVWWEDAWRECQQPATRGVLLRIGFVLGRGGVLDTLTALTRRGLGGPVGSGRQSISWLHVRDMTRIFQWSIDRSDMSGVYNATGPAPATNRELMRELRRAMGKPWAPPTPAWLARIGALVMGTEAELALTGRRCAPRRLAQIGFPFEFNDLGAALRDVLNHPPHVCPEPSHARD